VKRRGFLRGLLTSTATIVVAPACVMDELDEILDRRRPPKTFVDMGRGGTLDPLDRSVMLVIMAAILCAPMKGKHVW
jgi:hypothetical protein